MAAEWLKLLNSLGVNGALAAERNYNKGLVAGYAMGFRKARDLIGKMLEEQGYTATAAKVKNMELKKK